MLWHTLLTKKAKVESGSLRYVMISKNYSPDPKVICLEAFGFGNRRITEAKHRITVGFANRRGAY